MLACLWEPKSQKDLFQIAILTASFFLTIIFLADLIRAENLLCSKDASSFDHKSAQKQIVKSIVLLNSPATPLHLLSNKASITP